ncbi:MAG: glycosyltransferase [Candidatus Doudnabacteria bacterium]|nr:glycosyltransferase [Candidatus Doudnabacteria bacterium]
MRVLMLSLDRGLLGEGSSGDVVERHKKYADLVGTLDVIVFSSKKYAPRQHAENFRVFPTKSRKFSHWARAVEIAIKLHREQPYDLLITQEFAAPAGAKIKQKTGLPWLVSIHGMFFSSEWLRLRPLEWYLYFRVRRAIKAADAFRVNNEIIEEKLEEWGLHKPILVQPTAIDIKNFLSAEKPVNTVPKILYVGRLSPEKNVAMLIEAAREIRQWFELEIVGSGPEEKRLKKMAREAGRIYFLGRQSMKQLPEIYRRADIFVLPSNTESFGQVLLQAAAAGCAIIATRTAGARSIIQDGLAGILIAVGDREELKSAIERLITDRELRSRLSTAARKMAEDYNQDEAVGKLIDFWKEIARNLTPTLSDIGEGERVR